MLILVVTFAETVKDFYYFCDMTVYNSFFTIFFVFYSPGRDKF